MFLWPEFSIIINQQDIGINTGAKVTITKILNELGPQKPVISISAPF